MTKRLGIIGFGYLGRALWQRASASDELRDTQVVFVHNRSAAHLVDVPADLVLDDLNDAHSRGADLIVEAAHPDVTRRFGAAFLRCADYLPLSVTALADDALRTRLLKTAAASGYQLYLPVGALVGGDSLLVSQSMWRDVTITFRKNPDSIDDSETGSGSRGAEQPEVLFEGTAREVATKYPRNVNTMVTCALLSVGLDRCRARLISDPTLQYGVAEVEAWGFDGSYLRTEKRQPMAGVSGTEMVDSMWRSVTAALGHREPLHLV